VTAPEIVHNFDSTQIARPPGPARRATSEMPGPFTRFDVINGVAQPVKRLRIGRPLLCGLSGSSLGSRHSTEASLEIGRPFRRRAPPAGASGRQAFSVDRRGCSAGFPRPTQWHGSSSDRDALHRSSLHSGTDLRRFRQVSNPRAASIPIDQRAAILLQ